MPRSDSATCFNTSGNPRDSMVGTANGITRMTIIKDDRCRRTFTRNRPTPGMPQEQSKSRMRSIRARSSSLLISLRAIGLVGRQPLLGERNELAVDAGAKDVAGLDVQVRGTAFHCRLDNLFQPTRQGEGIGALRFQPTLRPGGKC